MGTVVSVLCILQDTSKRHSDHSLCERLNMERGYGLYGPYTGCRGLYPASSRLQSVPPRFYDLVDGDTGEVLASDRICGGRTSGHSHSIVTWSLVVGHLQDTLDPGRAHSGAEISSPTAGVRARVLRRSTI